MDDGPHIPMFRKWTAEEDERLKFLVWASLPYKEIGERMDRATSAIAGRVHRLKKKGLW